MTSCGHPQAADLAVSSTNVVGEGAGESGVFHKWPSGSPDRLVNSRLGLHSGCGKPILGKNRDTIIVMGSVVGNIFAFFPSANTSSYLK